jgi:hypothetical protein
MQNPAVGDSLSTRKYTLNEVTMKPAKLSAQESDGSFMMPLVRFIDMQHPLVGLSDIIYWDALDAGIGGYFSTAGQPAL